MTSSSHERVALNVMQAPNRGGNQMGEMRASSPAAPDAEDARIKGAGELIREAVSSWPGVEAAPHRFGGIEYRYGRKEMGHVHGDRLADLPLPRKLHDEVIAVGRAQPHHVLPQSGWVSSWLDGPEDAAGVIELFRMQYERYARPS